MLTGKDMVQLGDFLGRQCEIDLFPIDLVSTYKQFALEDLEDELIFYDSKEETLQKISLYKENIDRVDFLQGEDIYSSVFTIVLKDNKGKVDICVNEEQIRCCACGEVINIPYDTVWKISGIGNYGSIFDGEKMDLPLCDSCLEMLLISGIKDLGKDLENQVH